MIKITSTHRHHGASYGDPRDSMQRVTYNNRRRKPARGKLSFDHRGRRQRNVQSRPGVGQSGVERNSATPRLIQCDCGLSLGKFVVMTKLVLWPLVESVPVRSSVL